MYGQTIDSGVRVPRDSMLGLESLMTRLLGMLLDGPDGPLESRGLAYRSAAHEQLCPASSQHQRSQTRER